MPRLTQSEPILTQEEINEIVEVLIKDGMVI